MPPRIARTFGARVLLSSITLVTFAHATTPAQIDPNAQAQGLIYGVDAGLGETDNVSLAHTAKNSQTIAVADFDLDYGMKSRLLDVDAKGDFSYFDYLQGAYRNQLVGRFDGNGTVALIPEHLTWILQESFGQVTLDPFTPVVPSNLENVNTVTTGPNVYIRLGGTSFVDFSARVAYAEYEKSPYTNSRALGSGSWGLNLSALSSISLNADTERVLFENTALNVDFERSSVYGRYQVQSARTDFSAELGATVIGQNGNSNTGALARFKLARKLSESSRLTATLGRENTDSSYSFSSLQSGASGVVGPGPAVNTSENYTTDYASVGWEYQHNRTTLALSGRWEKDVYPGFPALDRTLPGAEFRVRRLLTRAFSVQVTGRLYKYDAYNAGGIAMNGNPNNTTSSLAASVTWRHGRALELKLACEHTSFSTSQNDIGYHENRVFLKVGYRPFGTSQVGDNVPGL